MSEQEKVLNMAMNMVERALGAECKPENRADYIKTLRMEWKGRIQDWWRLPEERDWLWVDMRLIDLAVKHSEESESLAEEMGREEAEAVRVAWAKKEKAEEEEAGRMKDIEAHRYEHVTKLMAETGKSREEVVASQGQWRVVEG